MNYENTFSIYFGPFSLSFICPSLIVTKHLERFFSGYECDQTPDFFIKIFTSDEFPPPLLQLQKQWIPQRVDGRFFEIGPNLIRGTLELEKKECSITVHKDFFSLPMVNVFQGFLCRLYHTMCRDRSINSHFIHGCGVIKENTGFLFIGPHQSGKTTVGKLSNGTILHDDQVIITLDEKGLTIDSPPLPAKFRRRPNKPYPLEKIFVLAKNSSFAVKSLGPALALKSLYDEIVLPLTLYSLDGKKEHAEKGKLCLEILKKVPVLKLHFDEQGKFWEELTNIH